MTAVKVTPQLKRSLGYGEATIVLPTYNEVENLRTLIPDLLSLPSHVDIVVVDDNSPDGTGQLAEEFAQQDGRVYVIHREGKLGLGTAYISGFKTALRIGSSRIITMDADYSHSPCYVPTLLRRSQSADLVIGSRYVRGGKAVDSPAPRRVLSSVANAFARTLLGLRAHDCTAGFRCYRRTVLESIDLDAIRSNGYSFLIELLYRVQQRGFTVVEDPILFVDRRLGASKISSQEIFKAVNTVMRLACVRILE